MYGYQWLEIPDVCMVMYGYQCEIPDVWLPVRNTLCMVTSAKYLMYGYQCEIPYVWLPVRNT